MTEFPNGFLLIREFLTITEAHAAASRLAFAKQASPDFRLIEVSPTAKGAWVCAFDTSDTKNLSGNFDVIQVNAVLMNALLSLGPKAGSETTSIGIVESESILDVLNSSMHYLKKGVSLLEIRIKRSGPAGAYAYFAIRDSAEANASTDPGVSPMAIIPLSGDYRRYFV